LLDNIDIDMQLHAAKSRVVSQVINLSHVFLKLHKQVFKLDCNILSHI